MIDLVPELLVVGLVVGILMGLSGLARVLGKVAAGIAAVMAIWIVATEGPYPLIDNVRALVEQARPHLHLIVGAVSGLLIAAVIDRERNRSRQS